MATVTLQMTDQFHYKLKDIAMGQGLTLEGWIIRWLENIVSVEKGPPMAVEKDPENCLAAATNSRKALDNANAIGPVEFFQELRRIKDWKTMIEGRLGSPVGGENDGLPAFDRIMELEEEFRNIRGRLAWVEEKLLKMGEVLDH